MQKGIIPTEYKDIVHRGVKKPPPKVMYSTTYKQEYTKPKHKAMAATAVESEQNFLRALWQTEEEVVEKENKV